jgi:hypothetical protein
MEIPRDLFRFQALTNPLQDMPVMTQWNCSRVQPIQLRTSLSDCNDLLTSHPKAQAATGFQQVPGRGNHRFETSHRSKSYNIKCRPFYALGILLKPGSEHIDLIETARARDFFQKGSLLRDRLEKDNLKVRCYQFDCEPGESSPTSYVEKTPAQGAEPGKEEAFTEVPADTFLRGSNCSQVDLLVPSQKKFKIDDQLVDRIVGKGNLKGLKQNPYSVPGEHQEKF